MIIMIAAVAENNALGKDNDLLWHLPNDFKRFKEITSGHHIIMGRKTFESFPKPLPNRTHVIITRQKNYAAEGCLVVASMEEAMALLPKNEDAFISSFINSYTKHDPTLPRTNLLKCPNNDCISNEKKGDKEESEKNSEIICIRYNAIELKYIYLCSYCDTAWK